MTWIDLLIACLTITTIVIGPGLSLAFLLGLRGLAAWASAAPFGVTVVSTAALLAPMLGMRWTALPVLLVTAVFAGVITTVQMITPSGWRRSRMRAPRGFRLWMMGTLAATAVIVAAQVIFVIGAPGNISQSFDNIFHLNAVRYALDNGNASPLFVGSLTSVSGGQWFYPTAWHAIAALTVEISGVSIPVAANAVAMVFSALAWPAGALWLAVTLFGRLPGVIVGAGLAVVGSAAFPLLMIDYGVLYPLHLGISVLPASIVLMVRAFSIVRLDHSPLPIAVVAAVGVLPGLAVAHPGALAAWIVVTTATLMVSVMRSLRGSSAARRALLTSGVLAYLVAAAAVWWVLRPPLSAREWPPEMTVAQALGEVLFVSPFGAPLAALLAILSSTGAIFAVRRRRVSELFAVLMFVIFASLYVVVAALPYLDIRDFLTGSWYNNLPRLAALLPLAVVPLAGAGVHYLIPHVARATSLWNLPRKARASMGVVAVLAAVVVVLLPMRTPLENAKVAYDLDADSPLISTDEMTLLNRLADEVEPDAVIAGSPWTGAGLAYAISGRKVLQPHTLMEMTDDMNEINEDLNDAEPGAPVCDAVASTGVRYVLDFGDREVHGGDHPYPGFRNLAGSGAAELVDREGQAKLYRVIGCTR